jgi:hypothetical protein
MSKLKHPTNRLERLTIAQKKQRRKERQRKGPKDERVTSAAPDDLLIGEDN